VSCFLFFCVIIYTVLGSKDAEVLDMLGKNGEFFTPFWRSFEWGLGACKKSCAIEIFKKFVAEYWDCI